MTDHKLPDDISLGQARDWLRARVTDGVRCPCCTQTAAIRKWTLYGTAVRALWLMYELGGSTGWVTAKQLKERGHKGQGDGTRLRHFGLARQGSRGYWQITDLGVRFLQGQASLHARCDVYDNRVLRRYGPLVTVHDVAGRAFDLPEHLNGQM